MYDEEDQVPDSEHRFLIIHYGKDRTRLCTVEIWRNYERSDYLVASRREFTDHQEARDYAIKLAKDNGLTYVPDEGENIYLD